MKPEAPSPTPGRHEILTGANQVWWLPCDLYTVSMHLHWTPSSFPGLEDTAGFSLATLFLFKKTKQNNVAYLCVSRKTNAFYVTLMYHSGLKGIRACTFSGALQPACPGSTLSHCQGLWTSLFSSVTLQEGVHSTSVQLLYWTKQLRSLSHVTGPHFHHWPLTAGPISLEKSDSFTGQYKVRRLLFFFNNLSRVSVVGLGEGQQSKCLLAGKHLMSKGQQTAEFPLGPRFFL